MRRVAGAVLATACLVALASCGNPSADLYVVDRSGSIPGAKLTMLVGDGGTVRCNGASEQEISSDQLIDARAIVDDLKGKDQDPGPATLGVHLAPQPNSILRYRVRSEAGTVSFSDTSKGQPPVFFRIAKLTRELAKQVCGLPR